MKHSQRKRMLINQLNSNGILQNKYSELLQQVVIGSGEEFESNQWWKIMWIQLLLMCKRVVYKTKSLTDKR